MPFMEISDRGPTPKWDFQEPGARLRPCSRELSFWRHDMGTPVNKQGVKLYKSLPLGTICRSLADQFSEDQICSGQGFDLIISAIRHHFRSYLEAEPEVQAETALHQTTRIPKGWRRRQEIDSAQRSGTTSCGEKRKIPHPETFTHSDTGNYRSRSGSVQTTTIGRLGDADLGLSASYRTESVSRECTPGMDDVSVI